jgi:MerR family mercuric resistance operon transcriptional regulator
MVTSSSGITIGRLAEAAGVNLETIRYYETIGIMPPPPRTSGGHRAYDRAHVRRLSFIRHARELGFGIEDIRALLRLAEPGQRSCSEVRDIAGLHLSAVRAKLAHLKALERVLDETVQRCTGEPVPACPVLDMLGSMP